MNKEVFVKTVSQPRPYSSEEVYEFAAATGNRAKTLRVAEFETQRLNAATDPEVFGNVESIFAELNDVLSDETKKFQHDRRQEFEKKLHHEIENLSDNGIFEFPYVGELFMSSDEINNGVFDFKGVNQLDTPRPDLALPTTIRAEDLFALARMKYIVEATGIDHIISGYARAIIHLYQEHRIPESADIHFILRDGRVAYAAYHGLGEQDERLRLPQNVNVRASYINSAMADPLVRDERTDEANMIYTHNKRAITKQEAIDYFQQIGLLQPNQSKYVLLSDTASMGTIPITLDRARKESQLDLKVAMLNLAGGWQGNPLIPNYTRYLATGRWVADPQKEDPIVLKKCEIVHTYAENNFSGYSRRPESLTRKTVRGKDRLVAPIEPFNHATSILSWVSLQAGRDAGQTQGFMSRIGDPALENISARALDYLWAMWTNSVGEQPAMPNIAFCPFSTWHDGKDEIMARWNDQLLENLNLDDFRG